MREIIVRRLRDAANSAWQLDLNDDQLSQYVAYAELLVEWNQKVNLTRLTTPEQIADGHFLDSLAVLHVVRMKEGAHLIDVGTGAGFPGIALKIARPDLMVTLLDGTAKKLAFCDAVIVALDLKGIRTVHGRAEDAARLPEHRAAYEFVTARAVAPLDKLLGWCAPFIKTGGRMVAMKGPGVKDEFLTAVPEAKRLHLSLAEPVGVFIPGADPPTERYIVTARRDTPLSPYASRAVGPREPGRPGSRLSK